MIRAVVLPQTSLEYYVWCAVMVIGWTALTFVLGNHLWWLAWLVAIPLSLLLVRAGFEWYRRRVILRGASRFHR